VLARCRVAFASGSGNSSPGLLRGSLSVLSEFTGGSHRPWSLSVQPVNKRCQRGFNPAREGRKYRTEDELEELAAAALTSASDECEGLYGDLQGLEDRHDGLVTSGASQAEPNVVVRQTRAIIGRRRSLRCPRVSRGRGGQHCSPNASRPKVIRRNRTGSVTGGAPHLMNHRVCMSIQRPSAATPQRVCRLWPSSRDRPGGAIDRNLLGGRRSAGCLAPVNKGWRSAHNPPFFGPTD
jgi:hypothetical protein